MGLKDGVKRRTYRERAQPAARRKFGLLEKKKDYILRAKDYHKKERAIQILQQKAELRNPDEFYFAMQNSRTRNGVHQVATAEANKYSQEELRLMKTQDIGYLSVKAQAESKKIDKLQDSLHLIGATRAKHTVFVDDDEEANSFDPAKYFDTDPSLVDRTFNRPRKEQLAQPPPLPPGKTPASVAAKTELRVAKAYKELLQRQQRERTLSKLVSQMAYSKEVMGKGRKRKLSPEETGGQRKVFRWKAERKK